jgi:hypothetical protein
MNFHLPPLSPSQEKAFLRAICVPQDVCCGIYSKIYTQESNLMMRKRENFFA